ncbi:MAG: gamma-glutamylcyclotransferase [Pararhodobacter sp.]|nr:gamma-glutamylcyclotransferase [Pararhodobacter sp.]
MNDPYFFGYGSLVNRATHVYGPAYRARVRGWRRAWRHSASRGVPFLTAIACPDSEIEGLVAPVPGGDWQALDQRETGYARQCAGAGLRPEPAGEAAGLAGVQIYAVPKQDWAPPSDGAPIVLSYVDVVFRGYLREFGRDGVERFIATTEGWEIPILDDRAQPLYPRHQPIEESERAWFDSLLADIGATVLRR